MRGKRVASPEDVQYLRLVNLEYDLADVNVYHVAMPDVTVYHVAMPVFVVSQPTERRLVAAGNMVSPDDPEELSPLSWDSV